MWFADKLGPMPIDGLRGAPAGEPLNTKANTGRMPSVTPDPAAQPAQRAAAPQPQPQQAPPPRAAAPAPRPAPQPPAPPPEPEKKKKKGWF